MNNSYISYEIVQDGIKVILEIPKKSATDEKTKEEIRTILTSALGEYLYRFS